MKILVIGATGNVGASLVCKLVQLGADVRVLVRAETDLPRQWAMPRGELEVFVGDLADRSALTPALADCDSVFLTTPHSPTMPELHRNLIDAAKRLGTRVVRLSGWTPSITGNSLAPGGRGHWLVEQYLMNSGLPYTILRVNYFMQNIATRNASVIREQNIFAGPLAKARISMIDTDDVAASAARVLTCAESDRLYTLTGPSAVSYADVAEQLTDLLGRRIQYVNMPPLRFRQWMLESGRQAWEADHALALFAIYREDLGEMVSEDVEVLTGRQPSSLRDYLLRNLTMFEGDHVHAS